MEERKGRILALTYLLFFNYNSSPVLGLLFSFPNLPLQAPPIPLSKDTLFHFKPVQVLPPAL